MDFEITIASCISSDKLQNDDIKIISTLLTNKQKSIEDLIVALEAELVSPIVSQKKRGIEIIEQVLSNYLPNKDFTLTHIKLLSCFVLNYISDWACVDSVVGIIKCIFACQDFTSLQKIKIDIREDENIKGEYYFNPIIKLDNDDNTKLEDLGPGEVISGGKYFKSYSEICSYHKFINHFGIEDVKNDDELYEMSISFYLITQVLYRVSTRQLIYSSRIKIIDFFLYIFNKKEYYSELIRLGPGIVPIVIQHIENEKDPRVLIKAFPLIQNMIENFQEVIYQYDNQSMNNNLSSCEKNEIDREYDIYQLYNGRIPKLSEEEKQNIQLIYSSKDTKENDESCQGISNDLFSGNENGILSNLISEVLFSYFPLQFQSSSSQLPITGAISPKDLKEAYISVITCSNIIQDSLIQAIVEYIDTQGLLENIIINYDDLHFEDEKELEKYLDSNIINNKVSNKPIHLKKSDQEILAESLTIIGMVKYDISPEIINKYISSVFLLINEFLKNTVVCSETTYKLLLNIFFIFINIELKFKNGQKILNTAVNQCIIPKLLLKLNSNQQLDLFAFNILEIFILTNNKVVIESIMNNFILIGILDNNNLEIIQINSKLLITLYLTDSNENNQYFQESEAKYNVEKEIKSEKSDSEGVKDSCIGSFNSRMFAYIESIEKNEKLEDLELPQFCLFLILKYILNDYKQFINKFFQALDFHWSDFIHKTEIEKNYITGISAFLLLTNSSESREHWNNYLNANNANINEHYEKSLIQNSNSIIENLIYTIIKEEEIPSNMVDIFIKNNINVSILDSISSTMSLDKWELVNKKISNIMNILSSKKWSNICFIDHFSIKYNHWVGTIIDVISNITDYELIFENKNLFYEISKGFGILTYKFFKHIFESNDQNDKIMSLNDEIFEEIESKLNNSVNCWLVFVYINELLIQILSIDLKNQLFLEKFGRIFIHWINNKIENFNIDSYNSEKICRLINLEVEKLVINLLILIKSKENKIESDENSNLLNYKEKNKIVYNKTLRYFLFNGIGHLEDNYNEIKMIFDKASHDYYNSITTKNESNIENVYSDLFSSLYITGSDLSLLKNPNSNDFSITIGKTKYLFGKSEKVDYNRFENEFQFNSNQNICCKIISIITICNNNIGKYLFELTELKTSNSINFGNVQNSTLKADSKQETKPKYSSQSTSSDPIEELWPEVISLSDNCYNKINLNHPDIQKKVLAVHSIVLESFSGIYPLSPYAERESYDYPLLLVPIISSMSNLNIKNIIDSFSSSSINCILMTSLIECTNFEDYKLVKLENPKLVKYLTEKTSKDECNLDLSEYIKEIKKLLFCKQPSKESKKWNKSMHELQIHNLQLLSVLMRILYYTRENKLMIYERRNQNKHSLDFVLENLCVYSILVSNILENHPNALVRFLCNLIISQIFKFPTVFRTNIKDDIVKSLTNSSNNDSNKGLRKMSCILKLKILTLNDHIY
ncbi:hypothetical protein CmeUKMEL1_08430 [Cryptosporidium meleagridis]|uniref:MMS19 nucleotide excision repair protein n=1 Tax=Cryptosporidium meleagridis TaxID=93969 RepID=A0A2P4Z0N1_9CRYT|nr:hypothetical protein CmeUKMEL1_08430 [Cryptosporidium meleagridis]